MKRVYVRGGERRELELDTTLAPVVAKWRLDRACAALAARGYERVAGDEPRPPSHAELVAAIRAAPHELDAYLVYADWLTERGDPWGELIAVQHALATLPADAAFERRRELERLDTRLRFMNAARLWGVLGETIASDAHQTYACDLVDATWRCGFLRAIAIRGDGPHGRLLDAIAPLDIAAALCEIVLASDAEWHAGALDALARHAWPCVERVEIQTTGAVGDVSAPCFALASSAIAPRLRELHLVGAKISGDAIDALRAAGFALSMRGGLHFTR